MVVILKYFRPDFFLAFREDLLVGTSGLERYGDTALLRSVAVASTERGQGLGQVVQGGPGHPVYRLAGPAQRPGRGGNIYYRTDRRFAQRRQRRLDQEERRPDVDRQVFVEAAGVPLRERQVPDCRRVVDQPVQSAEPLQAGVSDPARAGISCEVGSMGTSAAQTAPPKAARRNCSRTRTDS